MLHMNRFMRYSFLKKTYLYTCNTAHHTRNIAMGTFLDETFEKQKFNIYLLFFNIFLEISMKTRISRPTSTCFKTGDPIHIGTFHLNGQLSTRSATIYVYCFFLFFFTWSLIHSFGHSFCKDLMQSQVTCWDILC